jgi:hypothetical protein
MALVPVAALLLLRLSTRRIHEDVLRHGASSATDEDEKKDEGRPHR